jgi:hypothetical protein
MKREQVIKKTSSIIIVMLLWQTIMTGQISKQPPAAPVIKDFTDILYTLASDKMEGREAGTNGAIMASDYIAAIMQKNGVEPFGDFQWKGDQKVSQKLKRSWFQNFEAVGYKSYRDSVLLTLSSSGIEKTSHSSMTIDSGLYKTSAASETEILNLRNILGIIHGKDTTRCIIIGAHYDHLGIRDGQIYNGADDNASGAAGMLALEKKWAGYKGKLPCNIIFAAWTAEEKGEIGSEYFVERTSANPSRILACINMDMISRSAPEDSTGRQISIGTLPASENLRQIARESNKKLPRPFDLDLWDVTGHFGSDYAYFSANGIPVMTFFSGFNSDYHSPRDIASKIDLQKMSDILFLVNECIWKVLNTVTVPSTSHISQ